MDLDRQGLVMAVARQAVTDLVALALAEADDAEPSWAQTVGQGVETFFTVERTRDTIIIVLSGVIYLVLARFTRERMIMRPMRIAIAQELRSIRRAGVQDTDLDPTITSLENLGLKPKSRESVLYQGFSLRTDLSGPARRREIANHGVAALQHEATAVKDSLHPPVAAFVTKEALTASEALDLRQTLVVLKAQQAADTAIRTRKLLRRIRKTQLLGSAGVMLLILLVILFGNPALVAFGVLGALVSRVIAFFQASTDDEHKYNWVVLFLVPIVGGLSAYGGILLIDAARTWGILGEVFAGVEFGGVSANRPTMAAAFLFGFVERLLDKVVSKQVDGLAPIMAEEAAATPAADTPAATATAPATATTTTPAPTSPSPGSPTPPAHTRGGYIPRGLRER